MIMATATAGNAPAATRPSRRHRTLSRTVIALVSLGWAVAVLRYGAATTLSRADPVTAARIMPDDSDIAIAAARALAGKDMSHQRPEVRRLVDTALARNVTDPTAIEFKALQAAGRGDHRREAQLFALSDSISRRNLPTRLWFIQHAVDRGDLAGALENFDIALRTSTDAPAILFPVLARASADPTLAGPIARILDRPEDWRLMFLHYAITQGDAASGIAAVLLRMRDRRWITETGIDGTLTAELISEELFAQARAIQDAFHPVLRSASLVRDPSFADPRANYPFGWALGQKGEIGADRSRTTAGRTALSYQSLPGGTGQVASQLLILSPGDYRLAVRTATAPADATALPYWTVTCAGDDSAQIALLDQPAGRDAQAVADFTVGPDCAAQWLALTVRESDASSGQAGAVASASIARR
jgi:hypothetical protein